jgi:glutaredoxin
VAAREDYADKGFDVEYVNVVDVPEKMGEMLEHTGGKRDVPVIVEAGKVTIGFGGS